MVDTCRNCIAERAEHERTRRHLDAARRAGDALAEPMRAVVAELEYEAKASGNYHEDVLGPAREALAKYDATKGAIPDAQADTRSTRRGDQ